MDEHGAGNSAPANYRQALVLLPALRASCLRSGTFNRYFPQNRGAEISDSTSKRFLRRLGLGLQDYSTGESIPLAGCRFSMVPGGVYQRSRPQGFVRLSYRANIYQSDASAGN